MCKCRDVRGPPNPAWNSKTPGAGSSRWVTDSEEEHRAGLLAPRPASGRSAPNNTQRAWEPGAHLPPGRTFGGSPNSPDPQAGHPKAGDSSDLPRPALSLPDARGPSGHPRPLNRPAEPLLPGRAHRDARGSPTARACLGPGSQEQEITERGTEKEDRESWQRRSRGSGGTWWLGGQSAEPVPGD